MIELNITEYDLETVLESMDIARNQFRETNQEKFRHMTELFMYLQEVFYKESDK